MLSHFNLVSNIDQVSQTFKLRSRDRVLGVLPFFHSFGFTVTLWLPAARGVGGPGEGIISTGTGDRMLAFGGTSAAAAFVTGTIALLWSEFPSASAAEIRFASLEASRTRRSSILPPLLDAWAAYQILASAHSKRKVKLSGGKIM